ncbi:MAG: peptidoglycan bridge formation glycyltransferase FemA/FemB family protein [Patescibacteria group bacterium]|nr:peptidoglycan bridge formation glycyltransferase FemA/FemB family protein [Patescibacteria group bacterium]
MEIKEIFEKNVWEDFLKKCEEKTFLHSWNWGEFNALMGDKIWRFGVYDNELIGVALVIKVKAKRGDFLFIPHGPVVSRAKALVLKTLMNKLKVLADSERVSHIRVAPVTESGLVVFKKLGFRNAPTFVHPELTWELDITLGEDELVKSMRKTTRYLVKKAIKVNVEIIEADGVEEFDKLYQQTKERQHFTPFALNYLKNEFKSFSKDGQILVLLGKYNNEVVASGIFVFWQGIGFYHHGASSLKYPKIPVSYLLLWEAIKKAKQKGCEKFNFWGVVSDEEKNHPWYGLSLFKKGFGGQAKKYVKTQDFVTNKRYWLSFLIEKLRKIKRGL